MSLRCDLRERAHARSIESPVPIASSREAMGGVQTNDAGDALQLNRTDLRERRLDSCGPIDDLLSDEDLARSGVLGDTRGEVYRLAEVVTLLEQNGPGMKANVRRR
jgi:hypothetical protein